MNNDPLLPIKATQLEILQSRVNTHGNRLWQLPLTYIGIVLVVTSSIPDTKQLVDPSILYFIMAAIGLLVAWCMHGAYEGYTRTVNNMKVLEDSMGLNVTTSSHISHTAPYFILIIFSVILNIVAGIYL